MSYTFKCCLIAGGGVMGVCGFSSKIFETSIKINLSVFVKRYF